MSSPIRPLPLFSALFIASGLVLASNGASAAISEGEATGVCKQKIREAFGDTGNMKLKRIKRRGDFNVELVVNGKDGAFTAKCVVDRDGALKSFEHDGAK